jgi:hypothetical protein
MFFKGADSIVYWRFCLYNNWAMCPISSGAAQKGSRLLIGNAVILKAAYTKNGHYRSNSRFLFFIFMYL